MDVEDIAVMVDRLSHVRDFFQFGNPSNEIVGNPSEGELSGELVPLMVTFHPNSEVRIQVSDRLTEERRMELTQDIALHLGLGEPQVVGNFYSAPPYPSFPFSWKVYTPISSYESGT